MRKRRKSRELALNALYLLDVCNLSVEEATEFFLKNQRVLISVKEFAIRLVKGTAENLERIDSLITEHTENWEFKRLASVDRAILRIGIFELLYELDTPVAVIINEGIELAKEFSTADSGKFVNGVLDKIKGAVTRGSET